jgi:hypothetical protein
LAAKIISTILNQPKGSFWPFSAGLVCLGCRSNPVQMGDQTNEITQVSADLEKWSIASGEMI